LEETRERHQVARVLEDDDEERGMLEDEVVKLVVPSLQRVSQRTRRSSVRVGYMLFPSNISIPSAEIEIVTGPPNVNFKKVFWFATDKPSSPNGYQDDPR
jgi:hypothetical protein